MTARGTKTESRWAYWARKLAPLKRPKPLSSPMPKWPWFVVGLAALFFSAYFVPKFFFSGMYTETVVLPIFYRDVVEQHHSASTWGWGGFSAIFPDDALFFALNYLCGDGQVAAELLMICFFVGGLMATMAIGAALQRPHRLALFSLLFLLWVGLACDFGLPSDWSLTIRNSLFDAIYHSGTGVNCLVCLALLLRQVYRARTAGLGWLFVLTFLGGISDFLFLMIFAVPALATTGLLAASFPRDWKRYLALGLSVAVPGVAAYFLASACFPATLATSYYLRVGLDRAQDSVSALAVELTRPEHHFFVFAFALDVLTVLGGIVGALFFLFTSWKKRISPLFIGLVFFSSASILTDWVATIATGGYQDMPSNRYVTVALILPMILLALGLHAIIRWRPWIEKLIACGIAAYAIGVAFIPQDPSINYNNTEADIPFLKSVMSHNHIQDCLANYWCANITTFLSHGEVSPRSLTADGRIYYWFNNLEWFGKGHPYRDWPHFRLIYMPDHAYSARFGPPDQIVTSPGGSEIWLYSDERSIRYSEYFDTLSNRFQDEGRTLPIDPSSMPSETGKIQDHSRIVVDGQDHGGWFEYGPYFVLEPGNYRATFRYTYLVPPDADKFPTFDIYEHTGDQGQSRDSKPLPCPNTGPQTYSDEFTVSQLNHQFEIRLNYKGSGTLRVDALEVTYLGP